MAKGTLTLELTDNEVIETQSTISSRTVNVVNSDQQDSLNENIVLSMRPSYDSINTVSFSTAIGHDSFSGADDGVNIHSPAVHETDSVLSQDRDHNSTFLSTGSDQSSTVYSSR